MCVDRDTVVDGIVDMNESCKAGWRRQFANSDRKVIMYIDCWCCCHYCTTCIYACFYPDCSNAVQDRPFAVLLIASKRKHSKCDLNSLLSLSSIVCSRIQFLM